jgi:hypothetical protein
VVRVFKEPNYILIFRKGVLVLKCPFTGGLIEQLLFQVDTKYKLDDREFKYVSKIYMIKINYSQFYSGVICLIVWSKWS